MYVKCFARLLTFFGVLVPRVLSCSPMCNSMTLSVTLGSEVLLPCTHLKIGNTTVAKWSQNTSLIVSIQPHGNITFDDPKGGRVFIYPDLFNRGNFSILIRQLQASDVGTYCCQLSHDCQRVEINLSQSDLSTISADHTRDKSEVSDLKWYFIGAGVGAFILLVIVVSLIYEFRGVWFTKSGNSYYVNSERKHAEGAEDVRSDQQDADYEEMESDSNQDDYVNVQEEEHDQHEESKGNQEDVYVNAQTSEGEDDMVNQDLNERYVV